MKRILNSRSILTSIGILQPTTVAELKGFLTRMFRSAGDVPEESVLNAFLKDQIRLQRVLRFKIEEPLFALTLKGHRYLMRSDRKVRDKFRFYLLRSAHSRRFRLSDGEATRLVGASPAVDERISVKGSVANKIGQRVPSGRPYWPRISRQFNLETGSSASPSDIFPDLLSFSTQRQAEMACGLEGGRFQFDYEGLSACIGVSPAIISQAVHAPVRHYREFDIPKLGGGSRTIHSPRVFLKVMQWFISDYIMHSLPTHSCVHSFRPQRSIISNASEHINQRFVGSADIENFFGSITSDSVVRMLKENGFGKRESRLLSALVCYEDSLPQGAPTSPVISNSILMDFDVGMAEFADKSDLKYTRYGDDICFSGRKRSLVQAALEHARKKLVETYGFRLNDKKTRIASYHGQQRVTGVVVNTKALPPRELRRRIRAMFHNAKRSGRVSAKRFSELQGFLAYLRGFPELRSSRSIVKYEKTLSSLSRAVSPRRA